jgi:hypothetical protein
MKGMGLTTTLKMNYVLFGTTQYFLKVDTLRS